jgi:N-succinyldiaminopimelate aminotransferase
MKSGNAILSSFGTTVFEVMSALANEHQAVNLGQGFPDGNGPEDVRAMAHDALDDQPNQYPSMMGVPELRQAVAAHNQRFYGLDVDWKTETLVTSGATEALASCLFGLIEPGDEVVLIEPLYDCYLPLVRRAGGIPKLVRLEPPEWRLPEAALAAAFSDKTKVILMNTPMNPAGKVFTSDELEIIAGFCRQHDAFCIADEVYEHILFDGRAHVSIMTLPGMRERTARIGSAGKTFSLTGWKVGYVTAPPEMLAPITKCHQFLTFTTPPNLQRAAAFGLGKDDGYFTGLASDMQRSRDRLGRGLSEIGFDVADCAGTYFLSADFRPLGFKGDDVDFCKTLTVEARVTPIPVSAFYQSDPPRHFARFSFCKDDATLDEALIRMKNYFG